ncbi:U-box domain-containing protein 14 [Glycine soja]
MITCPKTKQTLVHTALTPNYVLKSLIALWCESNGIELPKRQGNCRTKKCGGSSLSEDAATALIKLLCEGTPTGKKDVATTIFNLSIYQGNKARAVKAGIVAPLIQFLKDAGGGMVDEALAIMAILASHHEGRAKPIHILVEVIRTGSPCNQENATAVLWSLCTEDPLQLKLAKEHGAEAALQELSENGSDRAKIKAGSILELLQQMEGIYFAKSQFGIIGGGVNWALEAANILHCTQLDYPFFFHHGNCIFNNLKWKVGDGTRIKFWKDKWREDDLSLQDKYPTLYQVSTQQNHTINSIGLLIGSRWEWKVQWRRHFFDHEIDTMEAFMADIEGVQIQPSSRVFSTGGLILLVITPQSQPTISSRLRAILFLKIATTRSFGD